VPGGYGAEEIEIHNPDMIRFIQQCSEHAQIMASVCTGAFLLAEAGLLDGKPATTHWMDINRLEKEYPKVNVKRGVKFVDDWPVLTSGGISAGIQMSFHIVKKLLGEDAARTAAKRMEYDLDF
jgi:transcriptional regulator GlxA family with amidase domain